MVNDSTQVVQGRLVVERMRFDGEVRGTLAAEVSVMPGQAARCLDTTQLGPISLRHEFLRARLGDRQATLLLAGERYLNLPEARLTARVADGAIDIAADSFARQVRLEMSGVSGAVFADNYFDLTPKETRRIALVEAAGGKNVVISCVNAATLALPL